MKTLSARALACLLGCLVLASPAMAQTAVERVLPSAADPAVRQFDLPNEIINGSASTRGAQLVVFLPGTGGGKDGGPRRLLDTVAGQGYRVIFLTYNDDPAVAQICPRRPAPCSERFRATRAYGEANGGPVTNPPAEAIVPRLVALLRYLDRQHPEAGWRDYLAPDGGPAWSRIVLSGFSQGAGMAAFIAKRHAVARVVLFSSPWDSYGPQKQPAPWLSLPSATPASRWWAERHARENTTELLVQAYRVLGIPANQMLVFDGPLSGPAKGKNPFHVSTVSAAAYAAQWRTMFGSAREVPR